MFQIEKVLAKFISACSGPDDIPSVILKLWPLYWLSLSSVCVPSDWKYANVMPLKGEVHFDFLYYGPISLTSVCSKSFERILVSFLSWFLQHSSFHFISMCFGLEDQCLSKYYILETMLLITMIKIFQWMLYFFTLRRLLMLWTIDCYFRC